MLQRSLSISLGTTAFVGSAGLIASYLSGGFDNNSSIKTVVWKNKPTSIPQIDEKTKFIKDENQKNMWAAKERAFLSATSSRYNHPWWDELLRDSKNDPLNLPILIAKWCVNNNDKTVDVTSVRGQMLEKLCDVSFK